MKPPPLILTFLLLLLLLISTSAGGGHAPPPVSPATPLAPSSSPTTPHTTTLDPKELRALQSLNIPTVRDPCTQEPPHNFTRCDKSKPFRHVISLHLINCSQDVTLSYTALKSLSTLQDLQFINCPLTPVRFPTELAQSLRSFTCINSFKKKLTGVWLSRLVNLTDLNVVGCQVNASGPFVILGNMRKLQALKISNANLTGYVPKHMHLNLTSIDFSSNKLNGSIPSSLGLLENLESLNLSGNGLSGEIPSEIGDLIMLKNLSLGLNSLSGELPESLSGIPGLVHVDLSSNRLNGSVPKFIGALKNLKYLNLANNSFHGVLPFNASFLKRLAVFKVGGNIDLCYNHTVLSSKLKLGIAPCDRHGLPLSPPPARGDSSADDSDDSSDYGDSEDDSSSSNKEEHHHGPNKVVLGVAIGLSSIVFLIVFLILLSKWCG